MFIYVCENSYQSKAENNSGDYHVALLRRLLAMTGKQQNDLVFLVRVGDGFKPSRRVINGRV